MGAARGWPRRLVSADLWPVPPVGDCASERVSGLRQPRQISLTGIKRPHIIAVDGTVATAKDVDGLADQSSRMSAQSGQTISLAVNDRPSKRFFGGEFRSAAVSEEGHTPLTRVKLCGTLPAPLRVGPADHVNVLAHQC